MSTTTFTPTTRVFARPRQLAMDQRPEAVVVAGSAGDVVTTVRAAAAAGLTVAPQSSGHNAGPLGDLAGSVLLRTSGLREIVVDRERQVARVGAGVLWGEVTAAAAEVGLTALAGSSRDVGVAGYTLGAACHSSPAPTTWPATTSWAPTS